MNILITGVAGLYGVHLLDILVKREDIDKVIGVDNFSRFYLLKDPFIKSKEFTKKFSLFKMNYQDIQIKEIENWEIDIVIHLAAYVSIPESMEEAESYFFNNEYGTFKFIHMLFKTKRHPLLIYASSPEVYGNPKYISMDVNHPLDPRSVYAVTKLAAEKHCEVLHKWYGYPVIIVRNFNTFGENQNLWAHTAVVPNFIVKALKNQPLEVQGDGMQTRDFQYVKDAVLAYSKIIDKGKILSGKVYNIGTGKQISVLSLAKLIIKLCNSQSEIVFLKPRNADIFALSADISITTDEIDWQPQYSLEEGLTRTINWYKEFI